MEHTDSPATIRIRDRAVIQFCYNVGMTGADALKMCKQAFGRDAPSKTLIYDRYEYHREGGVSLEEDERGGNVRDFDTIVDVGAYVDQFPSVSVRSISKELDISRPTISSVLRDDLHMAPLRPRYVAHDLNASQKAMRVSLGRTMLKILASDKPNEFVHIITGDETMVPLRNDEDFTWAEVGTPRPLMSRPTYFPQKVMMTVFWSVEGFHVVDKLEKKTTMNAAYFQSKIIDPLNAIFQPKTSSHTIWIHYDNCGPHRATATGNYVDQLGFVRMLHPPYSPDLAPCDFTIFANVKRQLNGYVAKTHDEMAEMFRTKLRGITREERIAAMNSWMNRLEYVIKSGGEVYY
jgi:histone-lysine N-methyltransferase SETMAR